MSATAKVLMMPARVRKRGMSLRYAHLILRHPKFGVEQHIKARCMLEMEAELFDLIDLFSPYDAVECQRLRRKSQPSRYDDYEDLKEKLERLREFLEVEA
jgi:hypothetical protein